MDVMTAKLLGMAERYKARGVVLGGGVSANARLRQRVLADSPLPAVIPPPVLCTDNGAMIASGAFYQYQRGDVADFNLDVDPSLPFGQAGQTSGSQVPPPRPGPPSMGTPRHRLPGTG